jgi:hypothetical protein
MPEVRGLHKRHNVLGVIYVVFYSSRKKAGILPALKVFLRRSG